jgi:hypothetical protein
MAEGCDSRDPATGTYWMHDYGNCVGLPPNGPATITPLPPGFQDYSAWNAEHPQYVYAWVTADTMLRLDKATRQWEMLSATGLPMGHTYNSVWLKEDGKSFIVATGGNVWDNVPIPQH